MSTGLLPPLIGEAETPYLGRRGMISRLAPAMALMITETFSNEPPVMDLFTTEDFSNNPPTVELLTTEDFSNNPPDLDLRTPEEFGGYQWNPNVLIETVKAGGAHLNLEINYYQVMPDLSEKFLKQTPFGTILDLAYPARDHKAVVPASYIEWSDAEQKLITYEPDSVNWIITPSYTARNEVSIVYRRVTP